MPAELTVFALDAVLPLVREDTFIKRSIKGQDFWMLYTPSTGVPSALMMGTIQQMTETIDSTPFQLEERTDHSYTVKA